jgi:antitoxin component of MazEF toxin-antitoxin module
MRSLSRVKAIGGSLMVRIPKDVAKEKGLRKGELIEIEVKKVRKDGFGIFRGIKSFTKEEEMKTHG